MQTKRRKRRDRIRKNAWIRFRPGRAKLKRSKSSLWPSYLLAVPGGNPWEYMRRSAFDWRARKHYYRQRSVK